MGIRYYYWILLIFTASKFNVMPLIDKSSQSSTECMMILKSHHCQVMLHQARSRITTEAEAMSFQTWCNQFQNTKVKPKPALLRFADANTLKFQLMLGMRSQYCLCLLWFMHSLELPQKQLRQCPSKHDEVKIQRWNAMTCTFQTMTHELTRWHNKKYAFFKQNNNSSITFISNMLKSLIF